MGPLAGTRVIEMKGLGPGPYAGMLLADMGADVIVVDRPAAGQPIALPSHQDVTSRGKRSIAIDLRKSAGLDALLRLVRTADLFFEGYRPGVAERLGFGPDECLDANPRLVYGRITGWGQSGPLARAAGHDINYISLTGALAAIGSEDGPVAPLNLVGDYAGGSHFLVMGMLAALLETRSSGKGQVIDAAITDGSASLMALFHGLANAGDWSTKRGTNLLDGGAYFYGTYPTADGKHVSIAALEPQFYEEFVRKLGLDEATFARQAPPAKWPELREALAKVFLTKTQQEWCELLEGTDSCFAPVLDLTEAPGHPHNRARETYLEIDGIVQPAPAPRFSRTDCETPGKRVRAGQHTTEILREAGFGDAEIEQLRADGVT